MKAIFIPIRENYIDEDIEKSNKIVDELTDNKQPFYVGEDDGVVFIAVDDENEDILKKYGYKMHDINHEDYPWDYDYKRDGF